MFCFDASASTLLLLPPFLAPKNLDFEDTLESYLPGRAIHSGWSRLFILSIFVGIREILTLLLSYFLLSTSYSENIVDDL